MKGVSLYLLFTVFFMYALCTQAAFAADDHTHHSATEIETLHIEGRKVNLVGEAVTASEGLISQDEIALRPLLRTGEILELVPGMVVTQHSGTGKANQYFLRGFNLDHGTDFYTAIDGMPVNMRTHGHGQGYSDLNFVIPEVIQQIAYHKGSYYAEVGDFSGAGSANLSTASKLEEGSLELTVGEDAYNRALVINSIQHKDKHWLYAFELNSYDGPWTDVNEDLQKVNALLKRSSEFATGTLDISMMAYDNSWNSADQIPARAVSSGLIDELGSLDTSTGGESSRYSINLQWQSEHIEASVYALNYNMNLWSNFTYFLDDDLNGDQFEQVDERTIYGGQVSFTCEGMIANKQMQNTFGAELRYDDISEVGLYRSQQRERLGVVRSDKVAETSLGLYWQNQLVFNSRLRSVLGLRYDTYHFDVQPLAVLNINNVDLSANAGKTEDDLLSAKGSLILGLNDEWESYVSAGQGFHSNDARGTTIEIDPADGAAVDAVDPLVRSLAYELGLRGFINEKLNASFALWSLDLDSELLFVGDAGTTEASRESSRQGFELTAYYRLNEIWTLDLEYAWTDAEFTDNAPEGNSIPGAIEQVVQSGVSAEFGNGWFGSARLRFFGERPLIEDNSVRSDSSTVVNLQTGYAFSHWTFKAAILNLMDSKDHDIDYFYASRLQGEVNEDGVEDIHYHVLEPRTIRLSASYHF